MKRAGVVLVALLAVIGGASAAGLVDPLEVGSTLDLSGSAGPAYAPADGGEVRTPARTANLSVAIDGTNAPVTAGETLTVNATVVNTGNAGASTNVTLSIGGTVRDGTNVTVAAGGTAAVNLSWETGVGESGDYVATIAAGSGETSIPVTIERPPATAIEGCTRIDASGVYELSDNVANNTDTCIEIAASEVILDGQEHRLDGVDASSAGVGVVVNASGELSDVTIRNLSVEGWETGIRVGDVSGTGVVNATVESVSVDGGIYGIRLADASETVVANATVQYSEDAVVLETGTNTTLRGNRLLENHANVLVESDATGAVVRDTTVRRPGFDGILVGGSDVIVKDNRVFDGGSTGIATLYRASGAVVRNNTVREFGLGVRAAGTNVTIQGNRLRKNGDGIRVRGWATSGVTLVDNVVLNNSDDGIQLQDKVSGVALANNTVRDNTVGIRIDSVSDNTFRGTTLANNTEWAVLAEPNPSLGLNATNNTFTNVEVGSVAARLSFTVRDAALKRAADRPAPPEGMEGIGSYLNATATSTTGILHLAFGYDEAGAAGLNESTLSVWRHNGTAWSSVSGFNSVDTSRNRVSANMTTFSVVAPLGELETTCIAGAVAGGDNTISLTEIQDAISWWAENTPVPNTDGKTISLSKIQSLINVWAESAPVSC